MVTENATEPAGGEDASGGASWIVTILLLVGVVGGVYLAGTNGFGGVISHLFGTLFSTLVGFYFVYLAAARLVRYLRQKRTTV